MIINNFKIDVFDPIFALNRILENNHGSLDDIRCLINEINNYNTTEKEYNEGDTLIYQERDYHKYPGNVAVVYEIDEVFKMQTFSNGKVGKLYHDILQQQQEIQSFFDYSKNNIIVLENKFGRVLPRDLTEIIKYINQTKAATKELEKHQCIISDCISRFNELVDKKNKYLCKSHSKMLSEAENLVYDFIDDLFKLIDKVNEHLDIESKNFFQPMSHTEKNCIIFGLYYCFLKKGLNKTITLRNSVNFSAFMKEMHTFIKKNPNIINVYCEYMDYPSFECAAIKQILNREGLTRERWIFAADDLL